MARILIIDDDRGFREGLAETLADLGHESIEAGDAAAGLRVLGREPMQLVFLDYRLPDIDGIEALAQIGKRLGADAPPVVMLTAFATSSNTIAAMKLGAFDHLIKPVGRADIAAIVDRALKSGRVPAAAPPPAVEALIGACSAMREVQKLIGLAAAGDTTVLITGETGTGKEVVARTLHDNSERASKPLVAVNCAAIPADLLESELFGHVKGAFSGAVADRLGCFQQASGGTVLLDEIGDMSLPMQAKILRALQEREISPVGATAPIKIDVRIVAATHHDLADCVRKGTFREDLFYRLNVLPIHLPPLRERLADILPLVEHFLRLGGDPPKTLSSAAQRVLLEYQWPGNVRELKNAMECLQVLVRGNVIQAQDLSFLSTDALPSLSSDWLSGDLPTALARLERTMIARVLAECGGNRTEAARRLGIHRQLLYTKIKEYSLE